MQTFPISSLSPAESADTEAAAAGGTATARVDDKDVAHFSAEQPPRLQQHGSGEAEESEVEECEVLLRDFERLWNCSGGLLGWFSLTQQNQRKPQQHHEVGTAILEQGTALTKEEVVEKDAEKDRINYVANDFSVYTQAFYREQQRQQTALLAGPLQMVECVLDPLQQLLQHFEGMSAAAAAMHAAKASITSSTAGMQIACTNLLQQQLQLEHLTTTLQTRLDFYTRCHAVRQLLDQPHITLVSAEEAAARNSTPGQNEQALLPVSAATASDGVTVAALEKAMRFIDDAIQFFSLHRNYYQARMYLHQYEQLRERACGVIRVAFSQALEACERSIELKLLQNQQQAVQKQLQTASDSAASVCNSSSSHGTETADALDAPALHVPLRVAGSLLLPLSQLLFVRQQQNVHEAYSSTLQQLEGLYVAKRLRLLTPLFQRHVKRLAVSAAAFPEAICIVIASSLSFCEMELKSFYSFFPRRSDQVVLRTLLETLGNCVYDVLRPLVLSCGNVKALSEVADLLLIDTLEAHAIRAESSPSSADLSPFLAIIYQLLQDVQERLLFRSDAFIETNLKNYTPTHDELWAFFFTAVSPLLNSLIQEDALASAPPSEPPPQKQQRPHFLAAGSCEKATKPAVVVSDGAAVHASLISVSSPSFGRDSSAPTTFANGSTTATALHSSFPVSYCNSTTTTSPTNGLLPCTLTTTLSGPAAVKPTAADSTLTTNTTKSTTTAIPTTPNIITNISANTSNTTTTTTTTTPTTSTTTITTSIDTNNITAKCKTKISICATTSSSSAPASFSQTTAEGSSKSVKKMFKNPFFKGQKMVVVALLPCVSGALSLVNILRRRLLEASACAASCTAAFEACLLSLSSPHTAAVVLEWLATAACNPKKINGLSVKQKQSQTNNGQQLPDYKKKEEEEKDGESSKLEEEEKEEDNGEEAGLEKRKLQKQKQKQQHQQEQLQSLRQLRKVETIELFLGRNEVASTSLQFKKTENEPSQSSRSRSVSQLLRQECRRWCRRVSICGSLLGTSGNKTTAGWRLDALPVGGPSKDEEGGGSSARELTEIEEKEVEGETDDTAMMDKMWQQVLLQLLLLKHLLAMDQFAVALEESEREGGGAAVLHPQTRGTLDLPPLGIQLRDWLLRQSVGTLDKSPTSCSTSGEKEEEAAVAHSTPESGLRFLRWLLPVVKEEAYDARLHLQQLLKHCCTTLFAEFVAVLALPIQKLVAQLPLDSVFPAPLQSHQQPMLPLQQQAEKQQLPFFPLSTEMVRDAVRSFVRSLRVEFPPLVLLLLLFLAPRRCCIDDEAHQRQLQPQQQALEAAAFLLDPIIAGLLKGPEELSAYLSSHSKGDQAADLIKLLAVTSLRDLLQRACDVAATAYVLLEQQEYQQLEQQ